MKSFLSSKHCSATPRIKSCSKPIHGSPAYYAMPAWWRLVNSLRQLVATCPVVTCVLSPSPLVSWCFKQLLEPGLEDTVRNRYKKDFFGFWRIAKENTITSCQLLESIWNRVKIQAQWNYGTLSRDAGMLLMFVKFIDQLDHADFTGLTDRRGSIISKTMTAFARPGQLWQIGHHMRQPLVEVVPMLKRSWKCLGIIEVGDWKAMVLWEDSSKWCNANNSHLNSSWGNFYKSAATILWFLEWCR